MKDQLSATTRQLSRIPIVSVREQTGSVLPDTTANRPLVPREAAGRDLAYRVMIPALALVAAGLAVGWLLVRPFSSWSGEDRLSVTLQAGRTPTLDTVARIASQIGGVTGNAVICVIAVALLWLWTREWWIAAMPALALTLHIWVHITPRRWSPGTGPAFLRSTSASRPRASPAATWERRSHNSSWSRWCAGCA